MSWAESMGDNDINGIWTLHRDHMVRRQHLWQIRDISARIRRENIKDHYAPIIKHLQLQQEYEWSAAGQKERASFNS